MSERPAKSRLATTTSQTQSPFLRMECITRHRLFKMCANRTNSIAGQARPDNLKRGLALARLVFAVAAGLANQRNCPCDGNDGSTDLPAKHLGAIRRRSGGV